jgi:gluconate 2-dehydrogenase gamma chain
VETTSHRFLQPDQARALAAAADRIFPGDGDSPSASALGAVEYIDGQLAGPWGQGDHLYRQGPFPAPQDSGHGWQSPLTPAEVYAHGLAALDEIARARHGAAFAELPPEAQDELLHACERGEVEADFGEGRSAAQFFALLKLNVVEGVFADPRYGGNRDFGGWRFIGFPEERARYAT